MTEGLIVDLFAGGGGASAGIEAALGRPVDVAINHDAIALAVHRANHPTTRHLEEDIWKARPGDVTGGRKVAVLWASPDCTHFSVAKGGKPRSSKRRTLAGAVIRWARATQPAVIFLENVQEFKGWGPLTKKGLPNKRKMGQSFRRWVRGLERLGYEVEWRTLDASLYGAPTRRRRLFIIARRDGQPIVWPEVTHGDVKKSADLFSQRLQPLRTAGECIDWSLACPSIFERKKPLKEKTLWRIAQGIKRFVIEAPEPFIVKFQQNSVGQPTREPLDTVMAGAQRFGVVTPVMVTIDHSSSKAGSTPADAPLPTTTVENRHAVVAPHLVKVNHGKDDARGESLEAPLSTVTATQRGHALVAASMIQTGYGEDMKRNGGEGQPARALDLNQPLGTVVAGGVKQALVAAFIEKGFGETPTRWKSGSSQPVNAPAPTITSRDHTNVAAAALVRFNHDDAGLPLTEPMPTIAAQGLHIAEVRAFLAAYYGCDKDGQALTDPLRTVTTKDRFGLVTVHGADYQIVDIGMRMLEPHELLRAQFGRFASSYDLSAARTKTAKVRLIGNSVCPEVAEAIVRANVAKPALQVAA